MRAAPPGLPFLAGAAIAGLALAVHAGSPGLSEFLGMAAGLGLGASGVAVAWERARRRADRLRRDRLALRRVLLAASAEDPMEELARVSWTLDGGGVFTGMRIWRLSPDGATLELLGSGSDPAGPPHTLAALPRRHPVMQEVFDRGDPVLLDSDRDGRIAPDVRAFGIGAGYAAPVVLGGRELGIVGARLADPRDAGEEAREFVRDLADAVAVALAAATAREDRQQLDAEQRRIRATLEAMPVGVLLTDPAGVVVHLNRRLLRLLGLRGAGPFVGRPAWELLERVVPRLDEEVRGAVMQGAAELAADRSRKLLRFDFRLRADGPEEGDRDLALTARPVLGEGGRLEGRVWVLGDVTEDRKVAERLERSHRMETLATLAGGLAHDLGNHLTAVLATADVLARHAADPARVRFAAEGIRAAARHGGELVRGLLRFARREPPQVEAVPVAAAVEEAARLVRATAPPGVRLEVEVDPAAGFVAADAEQIHRALTNLAMNAVEAAGGRGRVRLAAAPAEGESGDFVEITVEDDGPGMSEATRRRAFDPFFSTKPAGEGTGLGLAVTYGIVEAHRGRIDVDSAPGRGTRMRILWPAADGTPAAREPTARGRVGPEVASGRAPSPRGPGPAPPPAPESALLVVEDDPDIRELMAWVLAGAGFAVLEAGSAAEALARFEEAPGVAGLVVDRLLPDGDGVALVEELRRRLPGLPAVVVSGAGEEPEDPGTGFLAKPFTARELLERVREHLAA